MDHSKFALTLDDGDLGETVAGGSFARRSVPESLSDPPVMGPEADCFSFGHMSLYLIN